MTHKEINKNLKISLILSIISILAAIAALFIDKDYSIVSIGLLLSILVAPIFIGYESAKELLYGFDISKYQ